MAWIEKRGILYYVYFRGPDGKRQSRPGGESLTIARRVKEKIEKDLILRRNGLVDHSMLCSSAWGIYLDYMKTTGKRKGTVELAERCYNKFKSFFGEEKEISSVSKQDLERFKTHLITSLNLKKPSVNIVVRNLKTFFNFCEAHGYLLENPAKHLKQDKADPVGRRLTPKELGIILEQGCAYNENLKFFIRVYARLGLRVSELFTLKKEDIKENFLTVRKENSKTKKQRIVPIPSDLRKDFKRVWWLLPQWNVVNFKKAFERAVARCRRQGLIEGRIRTHDLRHTAITNAKMAGMTQEMRKKIFGHTTDLAAEIYEHETEEFLLAEMEKVSTARH